MDYGDYYRDNIGTTIGIHSPTRQMKAGGAEGSGNGSVTLEPQQQEDGEDRRGVETAAFPETPISRN